MKDEHIIDYISGQKVEATPENEAIQVFTKQLVEDYNYPKENIQIIPEFILKFSMKKELPLDVAVFLDDKKTEENIYIIVECAMKNIQEGKERLQSCLMLSNASFGVLLNKNERVFLRKVKKDEQIELEEVLNIPQYGQEVEES